MRLVAMCGEALAEGFALLGFETLVNASHEGVERMLGDLLDEKASALVFLETDLLDGKCVNLERVRREGARIVVTELPPLQAPADYRSSVDQVITRVLGPHALEGDDASQG